MANAVKSNHSVMESYKQDKVIFIIDECHRTQFGDMHRLIKQHFENAQYFGFTGTPRFEENKSQDGRATADILINVYITISLKMLLETIMCLDFQLNTIKHLIHMKI